MIITPLANKTGNVQITFIIIKNKAGCSFNSAARFICRLVLRPWIAYFSYYGVSVKLTAV